MFFCNLLRFYISSFAKLIGKEIDYVANARPEEEHYGVGSRERRKLKKGDQETTTLGCKDISNKT